MRLAEMEFPAEAADAATRPPLIVVHGLFGAAKNWRALAKRMGAGRRTIAVDLRNHGESPHDPVHDYPAMAGDLAETIDAAGGRAAVLGHSMGGKAAMVLAQTRPEMVERLLVADIAPVAYDHDLYGEIEAMRGVDLSGLDRRSQVEAALAERIGTPAVRSFLAQSAILGDAPGWTLNLNALDRNMPAIVGYPDLDAAYDGPTLFLHGGASDYLDDAGEARARALFPAARFESIEGAGHWLHAERPREFLTAANAFLDA